MDRRTLTTILICFLIFMGWQKFYVEPRMPKPQAPITMAPNTAAATGTVVTPNGAATAAGSSTQANGAKTPAVVAPHIEELVTSIGTAKVSNGARVFSDWDIKAYRAGISPEAARIDLQQVTQQQGGELGLRFELPELAYLSEVRGNLVKNGNSLTWTYEDDNVRLTREIIGQADQSYAIVKFAGQFKKTPATYAYVSLFGQSPEDDKEKQDRKLLYWTDNSMTATSLASTLEDKQVSTPVKWIASNSRYFVMAVLNEGPEQPVGLIRPLRGLAADGQYHPIPRTGEISLAYPLQGKTFALTLKTYFGPKELVALRAVDPTLDHTVDLGWFAWAAYPLLRLLKFIYGIVGNWGVAIILLTICVKILLFPLTYKGAKSMKEMAKIQPQLARLREKYKDDKEALNREMLTLMKSHGYNPMAGCLPILAQMPVFFALYRVLYSSIELYGASFAGWIHDLSAKDPYYVTPITLTLVMFIQQKLTPQSAQMDPAQQKMMQFMPIMFGVFMISLPSGLTIYMLVNALFSIMQQMYLNKKLGITIQAAPAKA